MLLRKTKYFFVVRRALANWWWGTPPPRWWWSSYTPPPPSTSLSWGLRWWGSWWARWRPSCCSSPDGRTSPGGRWTAGSYQTPGGKHSTAQEIVKRGGKSTDPGDRVPGDVEVTRCRDPRRLLSRLQTELLHLVSRLGVRWVWFTWLTLTWLTRSMLTLCRAKSWPTENCSHLAFQLWRPV